MRCGESKNSSFTATLTALKKLFLMELQSLLAITHIVIGYLRTYFNEQARVGVDVKITMEICGLEWSLILSRRSSVYHTKILTMNTASQKFVFRPGNTIDGKML